MRIALVVVSAMTLFWGSANGQGLSKSCLNDEGAGEALEMAVDGIGDVHFSRIISSSRELVYTHVAPDGTVTNDIIVGPVSPFVGQRLSKTDIEIDGNTIYICFRDKLQDQVRLAIRSSNVWSLETVQSNVTGDGCSLSIGNGSPLVAYEATGKLNVATRLGPSNWQRTTIDSVSGQRVGVMPDLVDSASGARVIVHRNASSNALRITEQSGGIWRTIQANHGFLNSGLNPRAVFRSATDIEVFHGIESSSLGSESDVALLRTTGSLGGAYATVQVSGTSIGGASNVSVGAQGLIVATRQLIRSALFGSFDSFIMYEGDSLVETRLETYGPADGRHVFQFVQVKPGPFGLSHLAYFDSQAAFAAAGDKVCLYRPLDTDQDRIPDSVEVVLSTNPNLPDTDADGRTDGEEVLIDMTDPTSIEQCVPAAETCDGQDEDCDQRIDEQLARGCYSGPEGTRGVGLCQNGVQSCSFGSWGACAGEVLPAAESCSGLDEDCDGVIDETFANEDQPCDTGLEGVCGIGLTKCVVGRTTCVQLNFPAQDVCSGADEDCDGLVDEGTLTCGEGECAVNVPACVGGEDNTCTPASGALNDDTCDGIDDDCDNRVDEDFTAIASQCGLGLCLANGQQICDNGNLIDTCQPATGTPDIDCNGVDDDCDGRSDEGAPIEESTCGVGLCVNSGQKRCIDGTFTDLCVPRAPPGDDSNCDERDDDCDGRADEHFQSSASTCGLGACERSGTVICLGGELLDSCTPAAPGVGDPCDAVDNDCDGIVDEDHSPDLINCGVGLCTTEGVTQCVNGEVVDVCTPLVGGDIDASCDQVDQDCDGSIDEDFESRTSTCGVGLCGREGQVTCVAGRLTDSCEPGQPVGGDTTCDGLDGDCDGRSDEAVVGPLETCGQGACERSSRKLCIDAQLVSTCEPGFAAENDATCDGVDSDCDGSVDEDFQTDEVTCGEGLCQSQGRIDCVNGQLRLDCIPNPPTLDTSCDGLDQDCDGRLDEAFEPSMITCGEGACAQTILGTCVGGRVKECLPAQPGLTDTSCDGIDNDCDGIADEGATDQVIDCGEGACFQQGARRCRDGGWVDFCTPSQPAQNDANCDDIDDDCDGRSDEDFVGQATQCGVGACVSDGVFVCENGRQVDSCRPSTSQVPDNQCNGVDDDCDGSVDEAVANQPTSCGVGVCVRAGNEVCAQGQLTDNCQPGNPTGPDRNCNGLDEDCDGASDEAFSAPNESCGFGVCQRSAAPICRSGQLVSTCQPGSPLGDDRDCNGLDDDCDGRVDEGFVPQQTNCGTGVCAAVGERICENGSVRNTCEANEPSLLGDICDGRDDDCDGRTDEDHVNAATSCGVGACEAVGQITCSNGQTVERCTPREPGPADRQCDGVDADCDGIIDEDYVGRATSCGEGVCASEGAFICANGRELDTCSTQAPTSFVDLCDGLDSDCDGRVDEDHRVEQTSCGVGACVSSGSARCIGGNVVDSCRPAQASRVDDTCDLIDEDCDGRADEDFVGGSVSCGLGICESTGVNRCVNGRINSTCRPSSPTGLDTICDGRDEDCDGRVDESFQVRTINCGQGICQARGIRDCENGAVIEQCTPAEPAADDDSCNGNDDDCDGRTDEGATSTDTVCGQGLCQSTGQRRCVTGRWLNDCAPESALGNDASCDGRDQDCDGRVDESFPARSTRCGRGLCADQGRLECVNGSTSDSCEPGPTLGPDAICDGLDQDCDGRLDEAFSGDAITCGEGACEATGRGVCQSGVVRSSCEPGLPSGNDSNCDGIDGDCDGAIDEAFVERAVTCGEGRCTQSGRVFCSGGATVNDCLPLDPLGPDEACDGVDDDCDGLVDEGFISSDITCGDGVCKRSGSGTCMDGLLTSDCTPGNPEGDDDDCDGLDQDCDGQIDESFASSAITCGLGACERDGFALCIDGAFVDDCRPGIPGESDDTCDGVDQDCDGQIDEGCPDRLDDAFIGPSRDAGTPAEDGAIAGDMLGSDAGVGAMTSDGGEVIADGSSGFYCNDDSVCFDGAFEPVCPLDEGCPPSVADPDELMRPIDNGCNCVQGRNSPFTWAGILVCLLLGLSRRRALD